MNSTELLRRIKRADSLNEALAVAEGNERIESFPQCATAFMRQKNVSLAGLAALVNVERTALYRIVSRGRPTSRNVLLRMALALGLNVEEAQKLLKSGRRCALSPRDRRDALLLYCLQRGYSLDQTEALVTEMGEISLYARG